MKGRNSVTRNATQTIANDPESKKSYEKARRLENRMPEPIREAHERN